MSTLTTKLFLYLGLGDNYDGLINVASLTVNDPEIMTELIRQRAINHDKWCRFFLITYGVSFVIQLVILYQD